MSVTWRDHPGGPQKRGPSWQEMVNEAARKLGFSDPILARVRGTDLQILEYFKLKNEGFHPLTNWLYAEMRPPDEALRRSAIHEKLAQLVKCKLIYTTNYDDFIERSLMLNGRQSKRVAVESDMVKSMAGDVCEVVKFHGDFNFPQHMVLSEFDYEQRLTLETVMDYRFRSDMLGRMVLFLGYSFRDPNVSYLFTRMNVNFKKLPGAPSGRRAYITVADPSDFEIELFRARNIEVIPISSGDQTGQIAELLEAMKG
ncbi:MAG: SIR2 family protein [Verrucomicrobia bacterium]|nr:MAG: SIR2 family protein [Verrucomicrobiota bacterium]